MENEPFIGNVPVQIVIFHSYVNLPGVTYFKTDIFLYTSPECVCGHVYIYIYIHIYVYICIYIYYVYIHTIPMYAKSLCLLVPETIARSCLDPSSLTHKTGSQN